MNIRHYLLTFLIIGFSSHVKGETIDLKFKNTLSVIEANSGDQINYTLENGRSVNIKLIKTETKIIFTTLKELKKGSSQDATIYSMECTLEVDGHEITMVRYVPVQQSFYEPYIVNGLMIWFDGLRSLDKYFNENHGKCLPAKEARFAIQDARFPVCPGEMGNWLALPDEKVLVKNSYRGEDTWMGTYFGADLHGGLDINNPNNTALYAPIDFDEHYYFNSLKAGHNNNRWRGIKKWVNEDTWYLQTHHLNDLLIPEYQPLKRGEKYAYAAGTRSGYTPHVHFVFRIKQPGFDEFFMDPWLLFWQTIKNNREKEQKIKSYFEPLSPAKTGKPFDFTSCGSRPGIWGNDLQYYWDFGDGYTSVLPNPSHVYSSPGIYPVTLLVKDGQDQDVYRQFITVDGPGVEAGTLSVSCENEPSFRDTKKWKTFAYGDVTRPKNTVYFNGCFGSQEPLQSISPKVVTLIPKNYNLTEEGIKRFRIETLYTNSGREWLKVNTGFINNSVTLELQPDVSNMFQKVGTYEAYVIVHDDNSINFPQFIKVVVELDKLNSDAEIIIDNSDRNCISSDFFWLKPEFHLDWTKGYKDDFLINKDNSRGEYARFIPNVSEGSYKVSLHGKPFSNKMLMEKTGGFYVVISNKNGIEKKWVEPSKSLEIGEYSFTPGDDNYVEIITDESKGLIVVDAIKLERVD